MPTKEEALAELQRREAAGTLKRPLSQQGVPQQIQQGMAANAEAQAMTPPEQEEQLSGEILNNAIKPAVAPTPEQKRAVIASPKAYNPKTDEKTVGPLNEYEGIKLQGKYNVLPDNKKKDLSDEEYGAGKVLSTLDKIEDQIAELEKVSKNDFIAPDNRYLSKFINPVKDLWGTFTKDEQQRIIREGLQSELDTFQVNIERELTGKNAGIGVMERFQKLGTFPELHHGIPSIKHKLNNMRKHATDMYDSANISLKTGRVIPENKLEEFRNKKAATKEFKHSKYTEEDIAATIAATGKSRAEVLKEIERQDKNGG